MYQNMKKYKFALTISHAIGGNDVPEVVWCRKNLASDQFSYVWWRDELCIFNDSDAIIFRLKFGL